MSLIVTGSIGIDSIQAPTGSVDDVLGGSAIYFAAAASFFGDVRLVAAVGDDFPEPMLAEFKHFGVDLTGLETRQGSKTFRWKGKYHENMNERDTLDVQLNVLGEAPPPVPESYRDSKYVFLANTHPAAQMALLENFNDTRLSVADTMDLWINNERDALGELLTKIDGLVLNDSEAELLTGKTNIVRAAEAIIELGPKFVVIKKGEHGAFAMMDDHIAAFPAFAARDVVDPTGAGDSFAGGMMGYLAAGNDQTLEISQLKAAMAYGTIVASYNIESFSLARLKEIARDQIDQRLTHFRTMLEV